MTLDSYVRGTDPTSKFVNVDNVIQSIGSDIHLGNYDLAIENHGTIESGLGHSGLVVRANDSGITNAGLIRATGGNSVSLIGVVQNSGGTLEASGTDSTLAIGSHALNRSSVIHGGTLRAVDGGTLRLETDVSALELLDIQAGSNLVLGPDANLQIGSGDAYNFQGTVFISNSYLPGVVSSLGFSGDFTVPEPATLTLNGVGATVVGMDAGARLIVDGLVDGFGVLGDGTLAIRNHGAISAVPPFFGGAALTVVPNAGGLINQGTLLAATGSRAGTGGTLALQGPGLDNTGGTIEADAYGHIQFTGTFDNTGTISILADGLLTGDSPIAQLFGLTRVDGTLAAPLFDLHGGILSGFGHLQADIVQDGGILSPGASPGVFYVDGDFDELAGGHVAIEIAGLAAGSEFDQLVVAGVLTLAGDIDVTLLDGFVPQAGDRFDIFVASGGLDIAGAHFHWTNLPPDLTFVTTVDGGAISLVTVPVPEPSSLALATFATVATVVLGRRGKGKTRRCGFSSRLVPCIAAPAHTIDLAISRSHSK